MPGGVHHSPKQVDITSFFQSQNPSDNASNSTHKPALTGAKKRKPSDVLEGEDDSERFATEEFISTSQQKLLDSINQSIGNALTTQMDGLTALRGDLTGQLGEVQSKIANVDSRLTTVHNELNWKIVELHQDRYNLHMDIVGIDTESIETNKRNPKNLAFSLIKSFATQGFQPSAFDIKEAYFREIKKISKSILTVIFSTYDAKAKAMKSKRESKDVRKIFFDHHMVPAMRDLLKKARATAKARGAKTAALMSGRVFVIFHDGTRMKINDPNDLNRIPENTNMATASMETAQ